MPRRERGRLRIGGMKRLGRCHNKSWLMCSPMKWWTNMDGHKSSTESGFFSSHQRLAFPCVWVTIIHRTGVPVPPHARLPPQEVMKRGHHKRNMARWSSDDLPVKLPWGRKMGSCSLNCGCLPEHPLQMVEDHRESDLAADLWRNTYVRPRDDIYTHWHWQIVNQKRNATTHWSGSWQARPTKWNGGSKMGKQSMCWDRGPKVYHFNAECSYLQRGTYTNFGGMALYPSKQQSRNDRAWGHAL